MVVGMLGRKVGMTQIFDATGQAIPATVIQAGPCHVLQLRTQAQNGYEAVQLGYLDKPRRLASRAARGQVAKLDSKRQKRLSAAGLQPVPKADCEPQRFVREFRGATDGLTVGQQLNVDVFAKTASVDVIGTSKGRGTAGVMKRHGFAGQRASHGVKKVHRHAGSIGCNTDPHHVFKGRRMAGRYGASRVTARNLKVVGVDVENNLLILRGAVPGPNGGYVIIRETNKL
ncbi:MAG: 50S ribosomal protein L3 [Planctomycetaceae bacterium]|nr:50S ribosomal protein L3 [Planctomycetaceae bacterium]